MVSKPFDWLKVGSYDADWPATVIEERHQAAHEDDVEPPPLGTSLKVMWALVALPWAVLAMAIVLLAPGKVA